MLVLMGLFVFMARNTQEEPGRAEAGLACAGLRGAAEGLDGARMDGAALALKRVADDSVGKARRAAEKDMRFLPLQKASEDLAEEVTPRTIRRADSACDSLGF